MNGRLGYALTAVGAWLLIVATVAPSAPALAAADSFSFRDTFSSGAYNGNDGSLPYDGPWWETNDWGGSKKGAVSIVDDDKCPSGECARIAGESEMWGIGLARRADTAEAASATLHFRYRLDGDDDAEGVLDIVVSDGRNWAVLDTLRLSRADDRVHSASYDVSAHTHSFFSVGFFARGDWDGAAYIDDVTVSGHMGNTIVITEPPTTSTTTEPPTTTAAPPTTTTSTTTTTTTTTAPPSTTVGPTTTSRPPSATTTPPTRPTTPPTTLPSTTTTPPTTTRPPSTEQPLTNDRRYQEKAAFTFFVFDDELTTATADLATMPGDGDTLPEPGPVTQIMASITVTAVTIRSQLLSAIALGLLIAAAAVVGLGRRRESA